MLLLPLRFRIEVLRILSLVDKVNLEVSEPVRASRQTGHVIGIHMGDLGHELSIRALVQPGVVEQGHALLRIFPRKEKNK